MKGLFGLLLVGFLAFVVSRRFFVRVVESGKESSGPSALLHAWAAAGVLFLALGVLLGPALLDVFSKDVLGQLAPLVDLLIGWVGWLLGLQLSWKDLKRLPGRDAAICAGETFLSASTVAALFLVVGWAALGWDSVLSLLFVATVASVSSPMLLALALGRLSGQSGLGGRLAVHTTLSPVIAVVLLGVVQGLMSLHRDVTITFLGPAGALLLGPLAGVVLGSLFHMVSLSRLSDKDLFVVVVGFVALGSGVARLLGQSPLFVNLVAGLIVASRSRQRTRIFLALRQVERPFYLLLLVALGTMWDPPSSVMTWVAVTAMLAGRLGAKALGAWVTDRLSRDRGMWQETFWGLVGHGGVVVAMAMSLREFAGSVASDVVLTYALVSVFLSPVVVPLIRRRVQSGLSQPA